MFAITEIKTMLDGWGPPDRGQVAGRSNPCLPSGVGPPVWETWTPREVSWRTSPLALSTFPGRRRGPRATRSHVGGEVRGCGGKAEPRRSRRYGLRGQARARACPPTRGNLDAHVSSTRRVLFTWSRSNMCHAFGLLPTVSAF